jgi:hypothetical protein
MFIYKNITEQIAEERRNIKAVLSDLIKTKADMEYMAMMSDIELDEEKEENAEEQV